MYTYAYCLRKRLQPNVELTCGEVALTQIVRPVRQEKGGISCLVSSSCCMTQVQRNRHVTRCEATAEI